MSSGVIHLNTGLIGVTGQRHTYCGRIWAERDGNRLRLLYDCVDDASAADCQKCLQHWEARRARSK